MGTTDITGSIPTVILAGGEGKRIGGDKAERRLAGETLLDHTIRQAKNHSSVVAVSVRSGQHHFPEDIGLLHDAADIDGPIAGLAAALKFAADVDTAHVAIIPCDTPFLPDDLLRRLREGIGAAAAAMPQYGGRLHPACSLWRADAARFLPGYLVGGRRSLMGFAEAVGYAAVDWPVETLDPFFNINTAQDLVEAERTLALRHHAK